MGNTKSSEIDAVPSSTKDINGPRRKSKSVSALAVNSTTSGKKIPGSARASISTQGNRKPVVTMNQRSIIKYCMDNAKDDIADRILRRAMEKKDEFRQFYDNLPRMQKTEISDALKDFLRGVCENLTDSEEVQKMAEEFGSSHVPFRQFGFRPDFFACTADAVTTECTFLDQATHGAVETAGAWSMLSAFVFSGVRDGYYAELRRQRKSSNAFRQRASVDVSTDGSVSFDNSRRSRSASPAGEDNSHSSDPKESTNFLLPPTVY